MLGVAASAKAHMHAEEQDSECERHIRSASPQLQALLDEAVERSATLRSIKDQIDRSNLIVYLAHHMFTTTGINGRLVFLGEAGGRRYVLVQIACLRTRNDQFGILGHELRHAAEIAAASSVVDSRSMAEHYASIGFVARQWPHGIAFESQSAADAGLQVQREVLGASPSSAGGRRASPDRRTPPPIP
jgi:hypothetical protein